MRTRVRGLASCGLLGVLLPLIAGPALAADTDLDDALEGFDDVHDELGDTPDALGDALEGFDDDDTAPDARDDDEALSGFDDDEGEFVSSTPTLTRGRFWELTGAASLGSSINYLHHDSATGTDYDGLSRLRSRLNLELDVDLPAGWRGRLAGYGWYDWAYRIEGRGNYTRQVLDEYEWDADFQEVWVQGAVLEDLDLKIGRQIVNWGRSDSLRVLDVLNPLDNLEPGLVDIEDLRRPVMMMKADAYLGDWSLSLIAIPEIRFSRLPVIGSDFAPVQSLGEFGFFEAPKKIPDESFDNTGWAARLRGIFSGWDASVHFARIWYDPTYLDARFSPAALASSNPLNAFAGTRLKHSRITLVGGGANYTVGSWLFKTELAWLDGVGYATSRRFVLPAPIGPVEVPVGRKRRSRLDFMVGVEYYGFANTTLAVEVVNRHIFHYRSEFRPSFEVQRNALETAIRLTRSFMNERLDATILAVIFGNHAQDGSVVRVGAFYDLRDALVVGAGIVFYNSGKVPPFNGISRNDRLFLELRYSF